MSNKFIGGYKIIDCQHKPILEEGETPLVIPGIYEEIESSKKTILFENIALTDDAIEVKPAMLLPIPYVNGEYVIYIPEFSSIVHINDDDEVYYTPSPSSGFVTFDLAEETITAGTPITIQNIFSAISNGENILLKNVHIEDDSVSVSVSPMYPAFLSSGGKYLSYVPMSLTGGISITVESTNAVTFAITTAD